MRPYLLQDLVRVRQHREEKAGQAVARARRLLNEATAAVVQAEKELSDYAVWRVREERKKLDGLIRRVLKVGDLSDARQEIAQLREHELELMDRVKQAEAARAKAEAFLQECRQSHALAVRELEKLIEHRALWQRETATEQERSDELELEEFLKPTTTAPERDFHERN